METEQEGPEEIGESIIRVWQDGSVRFEGIEGMTWEKFAAIKR